jgi:hypothetical protein
MLINLHPPQPLTADKGATRIALLKGRTIQDCIAWASEFIHQCFASKKEIILLKLNFAKDFDTIDHGAMIKIMRQMGFDDKWIQWISIIFESGKSAVLLNGVPGFSVG